MKGMVLQASECRKMGRGDKSWKKEVISYITILPSPTAYWSYFVITYGILLSMYWIASSEYCDMTEEWTI